MSIISEALKKAQEKRLHRHEETSISSAGNEAEVSLKTSGTYISKEQKEVYSKKYFLIAAFFIVLIAGLAAYFMLSSRGQKAAPGKIAQISGASLDDKSADITMKSSAIKSIAPPTPLPAKDLPVLNGIMYSPKNSQAILNGSLVSEGDKISGFSVIRIDPSSVTLSYEGNEFEVELK